MNREQTEDLKAFEQRLMDCVTHVKRKSFKWRVVVIAVVIWFLISIVRCWTDKADYSNYLEMFSSNKSLCLSLTVLLFMYALGFFDRQNAANIITNRCRLVLHDFNMSCDSQGKLILKRSRTLSHEPWKQS